MQFLLLLWGDPESQCRTYLFQRLDITDKILFSWKRVCPHAAIFFCGQTLRKKVCNPHMRVPNIKLSTSLKRSDLEAWERNFSQRRSAEACLLSERVGGHPSWSAQEGKGVFSTK
ncbi:hypothetical protein NPIL_426921 [Nephila pilipes]|uniref:Uncharacterized protein n=1 Tax=Nephila pilipes TaxID=299642 RepID=A0A8X6ULG4_NEPPI|nr:hypothetical protein NPIL_426921 [Nephila pilipes]